MKSESPTSASEALLAERIWMRRLARALVRDPQAADDLEQESWLHLHGRVPAGVESLRAWLGQGVRNLLRQQRRAALRRAQRERGAARPERLPSTDELLAQVELSERLARALRELPDKTRDALLLRYFEDLPPRAIAARLGLPVRTVESRLRRGLAQLREDLDRLQPGGREAWLSGLTALALPAKGGPFWLAAAAAGLLAAGAGGWAWAELGAPRPEPQVHGAIAADAPTAGNPALAVATGTPARVALTEKPDEVLVLRFLREGDERSLAGLRGRLGAPQPGDLEGGGKFVSDPEGRVRLPWDADWVSVPVELEASRSTREHQLWLREAGEHTVRVPRRGGAIEGRTVDERGQAVAGAEVRLWRLRTLKDLDLDRPDLVARSAADGGFAFEDVCDERGRRTLLNLGAAAPGLVGAPVLEGRLGERDAEGGLQLVMRPARTVRGRVSDAAGRPVAGARVLVHPAGPPWKKNELALDEDTFRKLLTPATKTKRLCTHTDEEGRFHLSILPREYTIYVDHPERPWWAGRLGAQQEEIEIALGFEVRLAGRALDLEGTALAGVRVSLICMERRAPLVTDAQGRFAFEGLSPVAGAQVGFDGPGVALHVETVEIGYAPEQELEVRLAPARALAGVLREPDGTPIHGARIELRGERLWGAPNSEHFPRELGRTWEEALARSMTTTGSTGEFRFEGLYEGAFFLWARSLSSGELLAIAHSRSGQEALELVRGQGFELTATVAGAVSLEDGTPPSRFTAMATRHVDPAAPPSWTRVVESFEAGDGRFELRGLEPGYWQIQVSSPESRLPWRSGIDELPRGRHSYSATLPR